MKTYRNEIERFIYEKCYGLMYQEVATYIYQHPEVLDLTFSRVQYPDSAVLEDMLIEYVSDIRISEDYLIFNAAVSGLVEISSSDDYRPLSQESKQWLFVACRVKITDKIESFKIENIRSYKDGRLHSDEGVAASRNIVPIIHKKDLDEEATNFLSETYPEALEKPMPVPIEEIAEKLGLKIIQGNRITNDFSVFGEISFSEGKVKVYDLFTTQTSEIDLHRGTILIDAYTFWERNLGCVKNTIAHEVYHWYRHRMYAAIKSILRGEKTIACRCPSNMVYPNSNEEWTDEQRMEWQANSIAPRILMPLKPFRQKVDELYAKYDYKNTPLKPAVLECIAQDLAKFYGVSRQSAIIRMIETGYSEAASIYQQKEDPKYHSYLTPNELYYEYSTNDEFRQLLDSELFRYVDGYVVINDDKYISQDEDGASSLTDYAWSNLDECALKFTDQPVKPQSSKLLPFEILHRANAEQKTSKYESEPNKKTVELSETVQQKRKEFDAQNATQKILSPSRSCWEMIWAVIESKGISKAHFCNLTGLGEEVYRKAKNNIDTQPEVRTVVAIAHGLKIGIEETEMILKAGGRAFKNTDEDRALRFCITGMGDCSLEDCNEFLESYGYKPLGSIQRL